MALKNSDISQKVIHYISEYTDVSENEIVPSMELGNDLGINSFDLVSIAYELGKEYNFENDIDLPKEVSTVDDIIEFVKKIVDKKLYNDKL